MKNFEELAKIKGIGTEGDYYDIGFQYSIKEEYTTGERNNITHIIRGYGSEGKGTLSYLCTQDKIENIYIIDEKFATKSNKDLYINEFQSIKNKNIIVFGDSEQDYTVAKHIFEKKNLCIRKSPGIKPYENFCNGQKCYFQGIQSLCHQAKKHWYSLIQHFFLTYPKKIIAITGTKGKSTVTSLCTHILNTLGIPAMSVGNYGVPVSEALIMKKKTIAVVEISSFMLYGLRKKNYYSIITSLDRDHLDRHLTMENYLYAKAEILYNSTNVVSNQVLDVFCDYNLDIFCKYYLNNANGEEKKKQWKFDDNRIYKNKKNIFERKKIALLGDHNCENIILACVCLDEFIKDISHTHLQKAVYTCKSLPSRLQIIGKYKGIQFIDDAIATNIGSTIAGIKAIKNVGTLFLGGYDKGVDYEKLVKFIATTEIKNIVLFGNAGNTILEIIQKKNMINKWKVYRTDKMSEAIAFAFTHTGTGETCLHSPASASFGIRNNYKERSKDFINSLKKYVAENNITEEI